MKYRVTHTNEFNYQSRVGLCFNEARLLPRDLPWQNVLSSGLQIDPLPNDYYERFDYFGNRTAYFSIQQPHEQMVVTSISDVVLEPATQPGDVASLAWEAARDRTDRNRSGDALEAVQFTLDSPNIKIEPFLQDYAQPSFPPGRPLLEAVQDLTERIYREFTYDPEFSTIATPLLEVVEHRSGVCQDFAHLAIGCLRAQGLAARYVSGYLETQPPPGKKKLQGADASHAWFSIYQPEAGWFDFDPTNNQCRNERYVSVAWGRDFADVTPLKGIAFGGGKHKLKVAVDVLAIR